MTIMTMNNCAKVTYHPRELTGTTTFVEACEKGKLCISASEMNCYSPDLWTQLESNTVCQKEQTTHN